jgi:AmmeMemoRadiSam system protein B
MYGQTPPSNMTAGGWAAKQDKKALQKIQSLDTKGLVRSIRQFDITMCGYGPVIAMLTAAKELGASKATLLKYASSYDIEPGDSAVGYGALVID